MQPAERQSTAEATKIPQRVQLILLSFKMGPQGPAARGFRISMTPDPPRLEHLFDMHKRKLIERRRFLEEA